MGQSLLSLLHTVPRGGLKNTPITSMQSSYSKAWPSENTPLNIMESVESTNPWWRGELNTIETVGHVIIQLRGNSFTGKVTVIWHEVPCMFLAGISSFN